MKIKVLADVCASGKALKAGKTAEVSDKDGKLLIAMGKAQKAATQKREATG